MTPKQLFKDFHWIVIKFTIGKKGKKVYDNISVSKDKSKYRCSVYADKSFTYISPNQEITLL